MRRDETKMRYMVFPAVHLRATYQSRYTKSSSTIDLPDIFGPFPVEVVLLKHVRRMGGGV